MTYTTGVRYSFTSAIDTVPAVKNQIKQLSVDEQLGLFWFIYTELGGAITPAAPGAARLQLAEGLLDDIKRLSYDEQLQFMRDLVNKVKTPLTRSYGVLSANTKLALWYQLAVWMESGEVVPMPEGYTLSRDGQKVMQSIRDLDFGQQITLLRSFVVDMGVDPF